MESFPFLGSKCYKNIAIVLHLRREGRGREGSLPGFRRCRCRPQARPRGWNVAGRGSSSRRRPRSAGAAAGAGGGSGCCGAADSCPPAAGWSRRRTRSPPQTQTQYFIKSNNYDYDTRMFRDKIQHFRWKYNKNYVFHILRNVFTPRRTCSVQIISALIKQFPRYWQIDLFSQIKHYTKSEFIVPRN